MKRFKNLVGPYCLVLFVLTVMPMLLILLYALVQKGTSITTFTFTFSNFMKFFDPVFISVLLKSLLLGILTTAICFIVGYPVAYAISRCQPQVQTLLILLITFPTWINLLMRTYAWINLLSSKGVISSLLTAFGFKGFDLLYTDFAVVMGMVYDFLPFMIIPIHSVLSKMDASLVEASQDLGATRVQTFFKITFKLSLGGVLTGITMVFLPAISSFVIPKLLGGGQYALIGSFIEKQFISVGDWHFGSAVSLILAILVLLLLYAINLLDRYAGTNEEEEGKKREKKKLA